ncbi:MAG: glycosyltransferase family 39 protein [Planctomycetia bacterium]|nr:glycosyltransferase family 39 protein [Planctomycetia bacterium]
MTPRSAQPELSEGQAVWRWFALPLALYLAVHLVLRLMISQSIGYDEAEQVVWSQSLAWGYGPQPPLYTWLLWGLVQVCGMSLFTLALMKTAVLAAIYVGLYLCARRLLPDTRLACLAVFSLLLMPLLAWGSLKGSTHSDLLCAIWLATFWVVLRLLEVGRTSSYLWLGVLAGLGMLSKYNYALFAAALLGAGLTLPGCRARLLDRRLLLTFAVALVLVLPHAVWAIERRGMIENYLAMKMRDPETRSWLVGACGALGSLVYRLWGALVAPIAAWLVFFPPGRRHAGTPAGEPYQLLARFIVAAGVLVLFPIAGGTTHILSRWLQPLLVLVPLTFFARLDPARLDPRRLRGFAAVLALAALAVMAARVGQLWFGSDDGGRYRSRDLAFARSVARLQAAGFRGGVLISRDSLTGANLRLRFPRARLVCTDYPNCQTPPAPPGVPCVVVCNSGASDQTPCLQEFLAPAFPAVVSMEAAASIAEQLEATGECCEPVKFAPLH